MSNETDVWTVKKLLDWSADYLKKHQIDSPKLTAQLLLSEVLSMPKLQLFLQFDRPMSPKELADYKAILLRRTNHEPLEYIVGHTEFIGLAIHIEPGVLIPRPETEELVIKAEQYIKRMSGVQAIVDIGTGSGVIATYLKKSFSDIPVFATDISEQAINVAKKNAETYKVDINFVSGFFPADEDINDQLPLVIVTNPPYIPTYDVEALEPEVKDHEPMLALDGGEDGFNVIKEILLKSLSLDCNVIIFMEIGYDQSEGLRNLCEELSIIDVVFFEDINRVQRIARIDITNS